MDREKETAEDRTPNPLIKSRGSVSKATRSNRQVSETSRLSHSRSWFVSVPGGWSFRTELGQSQSPDDSFHHSAAAYRQQVTESGRVAAPGT